MPVGPLPGGPNALRILLVCDRWWEVRIYNSRQRQETSPHPEKTYQNRQPGKKFPFRGQLK